MPDLLESPDSLGLVSICRIYGSVTGWLTPIPRIIMFSSKTFGVEKQNSRRKGMIFGNSHFSSVCAHCAVGKHNFWREFYRIGCGWVVVCCCVQKGGDYWTVNPLSVRRRPRFAKEWFAGARRRLKLNFQRTPLASIELRQNWRSELSARLQFVCLSVKELMLGSFVDLCEVLWVGDLSFGPILIWGGRGTSSQDASPGKAQFFPD